MASVAVEKLNGSEQESPSLVRRIEIMADRIRKRAYEIFQHRGTDGADLDDWLRAERDLMMAAESELVEKNGNFEIRITAPGFEAGETSVTARA